MLTKMTLRTNNDHYYLFLTAGLTFTLDLGVNVYLKTKQEMKLAQARKDW
jgi:hypothetical protein